MTVIQIDIDVDESRVDWILNRLDTVLSPPGLAAFLSGPVDEYVQLRAQERFAKEGDDASGKWAPLKPATQIIRQQAGYGASSPINRRTGELERYITGTPGSAVPTPIGATLTAPGTPPTGELKKKVERAQKGDGVRTVARPVMALDAEDTLAVLVMLGGFIETGRGVR